MREGMMGSGNFEFGNGIESERIRQEQDRAVKVARFLFRFTNW